MASSPTALYEFKIARVQPPTGEAEMKTVQAAYMQQDNASYFFKLNDGQIVYGLPRDNVLEVVRGDQLAS